MQAVQPFIPLLGGASMHETEGRRLLPTCSTPPLSILCPPCAPAPAGDLLNNPAPSTRRTTKQRSIASFLRSPAVAAAAGGAPAGPSAGQSTVRKGGAGSRRDLPDVSGGGRRAVGGGSAGPASAGKRGSPLPGLAGSSLPSPPSAKRLRTTFETAGSSKQGAAATAAAVAAAARLAGAAAAALEPSPEQALGSSAAAKAAAAEAPDAAAMQRQGSSRENQLGMCNL